MRGVRFHKAHGAGNDFVILDGRVEDATHLSRGRIRAILDRRLGIGGDGLILLLPAADKGAVAVRYWNSDGSVAAFCGNGARCAAELILHRSLRAEVRLLFKRRAYTARRAGVGRINLELPIPRLLRAPCPPPGVEALWSDDAKHSAHPGCFEEHDGKPLRAAWIDSGVPHFLLPVSNLRDADLSSLAPPIRRWAHFGKRGTNVDLVEEVKGEWQVRTWERGIEGETPACGSGLAAAGFYASLLMGKPAPVKLRSAGGDRFVFSADPAGKRAWLEGPACIVYSGTLSGGYPVALCRPWR